MPPERRLEPSRRNGEQPPTTLGPRVGGGQNLGCKPQGPRLPGVADSPGSPAGPDGHPDLHPGHRGPTHRRRPGDDRGHGRPIGCLPDRAIGRSPGSSGTTEARCSAGWSRRAIRAGRDRPTGRAIVGLPVTVRSPPSDADGCGGGHAAAVPCSNIVRIKRSRRSDSTVVGVRDGRSIPIPAPGHQATGPGSSDFRGLMAAREPAAMGLVTGPDGARRRKHCRPPRSQPPRTG
jgi:hypothetical protein